MREVFVASLLATLVVGCGQVADQASTLAGEHEPTIVLSPGYQINVAGEAVPIQGFDACPKGDDAMVKVFGPAPDDGKSTCIVIGKDQWKVSVLVGLPAGGVREDWEIVRETGTLTNGHPFARTSLRRPDGSLVVPWLIGKIAL
jgi:hypothetical protein